VGEAGFGTAGAASSQTLGLSRENRVQTSNFAVAPYFLHTFGDLGTAKIGVSGTATSSSQTQGFAALPYPTGSGQGSSLFTTEQTAQFTTGDVLSALQDTISVDLSQTTTRTNQLVSASGVTTQIPDTSIRSTREIFSNRVNYALTHWASVFATFGHEDINYSNASFRRINDFTWMVGTTLDPNPDSEVTLSYGHQNGFTSAQATARYALTARTLVSGSYTDTLGTELEQVASQAQAGIIGPNGQFINAETGAPLPLNLYQTITAPTVFRYRTVQITAQMLKDLDLISASLTYGVQSSVGTGIQTSGNSRSATVQWRHEFNQAFSLTSSLSYQEQSQSNLDCPASLGAACANNSKSSLGSLVFGGILNYVLNETLSAHLRYVFTSRNSTVANQSMYQDVVLVGITKQF
jgi:hypothetical protein